MGVDLQKKVEGTPSLPPFPLEVGHLNPARGYGQHCKLPHQGLGQTQQKFNLVHFILKIRHLLARI